MDLKQEDSNDHPVYGPWVPVTQAIAGDNWGSQFIPRVGDEVLVDFIDGDIDQPVVIGSVYNGINTPVFGEGITDSTIAQSGYQTRLIHKDGTTSEGHKLLFNDSKGIEGIELINSF
jgi:type VI secretion system secreted protein VgrG